MLRTAMKERGLSFKGALNAAIRAGLGNPQQFEATFSQKTFSLGSEPSFPWEKALSIAASLEDIVLIQRWIPRK